MRLQIFHETHYRYSAPVVLSQQVLHLTPRALPWQDCEQHRISIEPAASETVKRTDYYGNHALHVVVAAPHEALLVRAESVVSVKPRARERRAAPKTAALMFA